MQGVAFNIAIFQGGGGLNNLNTLCLLWRNWQGPSVNRRSIMGRLANKGDKMIEKTHSVEGGKGWGIEEWHRPRLNELVTKC